MQRYRHDFNSKEAAQDIVSFKAEVEGDRVQLERQNHSKIFMLCFMKDLLMKKKQPEQQLSFEKYCSVSKTLEPTAIHYNVVLNGWN
jgi:putative redox protein